MWLAFVSNPRFDPNGVPDWRPFMTLIYYPTWSRIDDLIAGICVALINIFRPSWWKAMSDVPLLLLGGGLAGIAVSIFWFDHPIPALLPTMFAFPLLSWSIALLVAGAASEQSPLNRYNIPGVGALAAGAYSLYLSHKIAFNLVKQSSIEGWGRLAAAVVLALALGAVLYWCVERPFLIIRERLPGLSRDRHPERGAKVLS